MTRLSFRVSNEIANIFRRQAFASGQSLSIYLSELIKNDFCTFDGWPKGYFDIFGKWEGDTIERP